MDWSSRLDPEDLREMMQHYQAVVVASNAKRYEGFVAQHLGDGMLLYFGYPRAHEDDPVRALHAAVAILEQLVPLSDQMVKRSRYGSARIRD